ncbi:MAG: preprotein translocase subunit SecY [Bacteroidia bacterium]|nr:preprotein translocase subunit SecY [Bacteroidia bacterium]NNM16443.1 preprotein translocase subunit SecY [Bacteroidia bacterium]
MRKLLTTIQNIWKIDDLRIKILNTLFFLLIYRLGSHIVIPGVNPNELGALGDQASGGILGLLDLFAGGAFSRASIFALGIMPYISASIIVQLLGVAIPKFQKMQREGESGRKKLNQFTRFLTVLVCLGQAPGYLVNLANQSPGALVINTHEGLISTPFWWVTSVVLLISGCLFVMWLGERITEKGIGNGISLIIMIGIIASLPFSLKDELLSRLNQGGGPIAFLAEMLIWLIVIGACILLVQGVRRIPVQFAKKIVGNKQYGGARQFIPLKVNASGVMPLIFAQAIMFIPATVAQFFPESDSWQGFAAQFTNFTSFGYNFVFFILIILFTYFYTAITVNPNQMADDMKKNGGFIPGVKPGRKTAEFIDDIMSKITLPGSIFLGIVAILPAFAMLAGVSANFAQFYGGTSLLILVGVVLDTLQQIESHLLMRHYDGLMKGGGRLKGRAAVGAAI